jgi:hypothetical protein
MENLSNEIERLQALEREADARGRHTIRLADIPVDLSERFEASIFLSACPMIGGEVHVQNVDWIMFLGTQVQKLKLRRKREEEYR